MGTKYTRPSGQFKDSNTSYEMNQRTVESTEFKTSFSLQFKNIPYP